MYDINLNKEFLAKRIRDARKEAGKSQKEVAEKLNVAQANYSKIERAEQYVRFETIIEICNILQVDINFFLIEIPAKKNKKDDPIKKAYNQAKDKYLSKNINEKKAITDDGTIPFVADSLKSILYNEGFESLLKSIKGKIKDEMYEKLRIDSVIRNSSIQDLLDIVMFLQDEDIQRVCDMVIGFVFSNYPKNQEQE